MREKPGVAKRELLAVLTATIVLGAALAIALTGREAPSAAISNAIGHTHPPGYPAHEHLPTPTADGP